MQKHTTVCERRKLNELRHSFLEQHAARVDNITNHTAHKTAHVALLLNRIQKAFNHAGGPQNQTHGCTS